MRSHVRARFWLEAAIALLGGALGVLSVFWHDWIEAVTGMDPDHHSGSTEWAIVAGLLLISVTVGIAARNEWRHTARGIALAHRGGQGRGSA